MVPDVSTGSDTRGLIVYLIAPSRNPCEGDGDAEADKPA
jgi:hypothetical protein